MCQVKILLERIRQKNKNKARNKVERRHKKQYQTNKSQIISTPDSIYK